MRTGEPQIGQGSREFMTLRFGNGGTKGQEFIVIGTGQ